MEENTFMLSMWLGLVGLILGFTISIQVYCYQENTKMASLGFVEVTTHVDGSNYTHYVQSKQGAGMFKVINGGQLPQRETRYSAGFDVFANENVIIGAGETVLVGLGICLDGVLMDDMAYKKFGFDVTSDDFKAHYYFELHPRSSLRAKGLGGGVGIIDMDYRDEIKIVIHKALNGGADFGCARGGFIGFGDDRHSYSIKKGDKIGQLILKRHEGWLLPDEYTLDAERNGGFGSTGGVV